MSVSEVVNELVEARKIYFHQSMSPLGEKHGKPILMAEKKVVDTLCQQGITVTKLRAADGKYSQRDKSYYEINLSSLRQAFEREANAPSNMMNENPRSATELEANALAGIETRRDHVIFKLSHAEKVKQSRHADGEKDTHQHPYSHAAR